jgi:L-threonylcarbamoyladenylate synthase
VRPFAAADALMRIALTHGVPDDATLRAAATCIASGGTLIFPTETVYGIGCDPENASAVAAIFRLKGRPADKPLAIHVASPDQAPRYARTLTRCAQRIMGALWPGPIAIVVERAHGIASPAALDGATISLRCPDDAACAAILRACGPLAATSANRSGEPAFNGDEASVASLPDAALAIITGPTLLRQESTVVDCTADLPRIIRQGAVDAARIERIAR